MREPFLLWKSFEADTGFWKMSRTNGEKHDALAVDIRRQLGNETTKRFLRTLPAFRTETDIPDRLKKLLDRLDGIETNMVAGGRRR